ADPAPVDARLLDASTPLVPAGGASHTVVVLFTDGAHRSVDPAVADHADAIVVHRTRISDHAHRAGAAAAIDVGFRAVTRPVVAGGRGTGHLVTQSTLAIEAEQAVEAVGARRAEAAAVDVGLDPVAHTVGAVCGGAEAGD